MVRQGKYADNYFFSNRKLIFKILQLAEIGKKRKIPLHMDGARIFNAAVYLNVPVTRITRDFTTVQFCFSKGLGAPVGSMLVGPRDLILKLVFFAKLI